MELVGGHLRISRSASDNGLAGGALRRKQIRAVHGYDIHIVTGLAGDAFAGALIYALLNKFTLQEAAEFGAAASCLKQTIPGDFNHVTLAEVEALARGDGSGRVKR